MARKKTSTADETQVLVLSRRRCALCFGLHGDHRPKAGQIAHVDRDASNSALNNLAWLCLQDHDEYDTRRSQSKGFTPAELKTYRDELYSFIRAERAALSQAPPPMFLTPEGLELARVLSEKSRNGYRLDGQIRIDALPALLNLSEDDVEIAIDELRDGGLLELNGSREIVFPTNRLFWETDPQFQEWDPVRDAEEIARVLATREERLVPIAELANALNWTPRRFNPAATFLVASGIAGSQEGIGSAPYYFVLLAPTATTRRFVRDLDRANNAV